MIRPGVRSLRRLYGVDVPALAEQIDRIDLTASASAALNNLINARASVPVTVTPARTTGRGPGGEDRALAPT